MVDSIQSMSSAGCWLNGVNHSNRSLNTQNMSNEYLEESELFESDDSLEENSDDESTTYIEKKGEEINNDDKSQEAKDRQVDAFTRKVITGELSLDELPERQQWLRPLVEERLKTSEDAISKMVDDRLVVKLKEKEDTDLFDTLKSKLASTKLTKAEKDEIETEFKDLKSYLTPGKALEKAIRIAKIDIDVQSVRQSMAIPKAGRQESTKSVDVTELSPDDRLAFYEKLRRGR